MTDEQLRGGRFGRGIALAVIVGFQLMLVVDGTILNVALPAIRYALDFTPTTLSWVTNAYALAMGGLLLLGGRAGDILGRRRTFLVGVALFTLSSLVAGLSATAGVLVAARAAQGVGAAFAGPSTLSLIATNFGEGPERHRALGYFSAAAGGGGSLGIIAGGLLTEWASWRWVMFVNIPIGLAILLLAPRHVQESERHTGKFDLPGALSSSVGVAALTYGLIRGASDGWSDAITIAAFGVAGTGLAVFVFIERRARQPIVPLEILTQPTRGATYLNMLLFAAAMIGVFYFLTLFVQDTLGFTPLQAGLGFLAMTVSMFATTRVTPRLVVRFGAKPAAVAGSALLTIALLWLSQVHDTSTYRGSLLGPLLLDGVGIGLTFMPLNSIILASVPARDTGAASGLLQASQRIGTSVGLAVLVAVAANGHSLADQADRAYLAAAILSFIALLTTIFVIKPNRPASRPPLQRPRQPDVTEDHSNDQVQPKPRR